MNKGFQSYMKGNKQFEIIILTYIIDSHLWSLSKLQKEGIYNTNDYCFVVLILLVVFLHCFSLCSLIWSLAVLSRLLYQLVFLISSNQKQMCFFVSDNVQQIVFLLRANFFKWTIGFLSFSQDGDQTGFSYPLDFEMIWKL